MFNSLNLDNSAESVQNIVDSIRCIVCDKTNGSRARYSCGHSACTECADFEPDCLLCLTPPLADDDTRPIFDDVLTTRVKHANELLQTFQETFQVDVARRKRISEHLKKEKELFPECIQAVHTYHNKRKSNTTFNETRGNKHKCVLPGEEVESPRSVKMDTSKNYVQNWLDQNEYIEYKHRKPLYDLEVNSPQIPSTSPKSRTPFLNKRKEKELHTGKKNRKRTHGKTALHVDKSQSLVDLFLEKKVKGETSGWKSVKRLKKEFDDCDKETLTKQKKCEIEDSEIYKDNEIFTIEDSQDYKTDKNKQKVESKDVKDDEAIIIEGSQDYKIDKDRQAWLAVLQAYENETPTSTKSNDDSLRKCKELIDYTNDIEVTAEKCLKNIDLKSKNMMNLMNSKANNIKLCSVSSHKVQFFKRSTLHDLCRVCDIEEKQRIRSKNSNIVSVRVETDKVITKITVSRLLTSQQACPKKHSKQIQMDGDVANVHANTDVTKTTLAAHVANNKNQNYSKVLIDNVTSQDLFTGEPEANAYFEPVGIGKENETTVVIESSSDSEIEQSTSLMIVADVHQSRNDEERNVLGELLSENRNLRSVAREYSPESSNSSDKENRDPNIMKKRHHLKDSKKKYALWAKKSHRF